MLSQYAGVLSLLQDASALQLSAFIHVVSVRTAAQTRVSFFCWPSCANSGAHWADISAQVER